MLFGVLYLYKIAGTTDYITLLHTELTYDQQLVLWGCFFLAFAVKTPLFPVHI
jgi:NADH-quinone oxidoreductase subunit M